MRDRFIPSLPDLSSNEGSTLLPVIIIGAVVMSSLMLSPSFYNSVQDKIHVQEARRRADDEVLKIQTFFQYPSICRQVMDEALKIQGPNTDFKSPNELFVAIRKRASMDSDAPVATEIGWGERQGVASIDTGPALFNGNPKIYKANLNLAFSRTGSDNTSRVARSYTLPVYLAIGPGNSVQYCELMQISGSTVDRLSVEDRICRLQFGATQPGILYNPVTTLCQPPGP